MRTPTSRWARRPGSISASPISIAPLRFYGAVFGWEFDVGPEEHGRYTTCLLRGRPVAAISAHADPSTGCFWNVHLATPDCDGTAEQGRMTGVRRHCPDP
jgi:predicted enzyme related to lactoylglutathione lyase